MTTRKPNAQKTLQKRQAASEAAKQAATKRNQPNEIAQKALMQRQGKKLHLRDRGNQSK